MGLSLFVYCSLLQRHRQLRTGNSIFVDHWEQFEIWRLNGERWELVAAFHDFELANAVAMQRSSRIRLVHTVYEGGKLVEKEVLMEVGAPRTEP